MVSVLQDIPDVVCEAMIDVYFKSRVRIKLEANILSENIGLSYLSLQIPASQLKLYKRQ